MKIAFWGLGSIAKRHIKNLANILDDRKIDYLIDVYRHNSSDNEGIKQIDRVIESDILLDEYDVIFITNPTSLHYETINKCYKKAKYLFIEKPVFSSCSEDINKLNYVRENSYVACPLRYTSVYRYIKENINVNKVISAKAISSSYLPEWRPGTDYRKTYSAHKDMGGGVAIDLIHEWDYLVNLFGYPEKTYYIGGTFSNLEIDSDDLAIYISRYSDKTVELHLDYFGRVPIRKLELLMEDDTVVADFIAGTVTYAKEGKLVDLQEARDSYQTMELKHFLDIMTGGCENDSTVDDAVEVLKIATNYSIN